MRSKLKNLKRKLRNGMKRIMPIRSNSNHYNVNSLHVSEMILMIFLVSSAFIAKSLANKAKRSA